MIPPHTPPGAKIVALKTIDMPGFPVIRQFETYTLREWVTGLVADGSPAAGLQVAEADHSLTPFGPFGPAGVCFHPSLFDLAVLPACLTDLLAGLPVTALPNPLDARPRPAAREASP